MKSSTHATRISLLATTLFLLTGCGGSSSSAPDITEEQSSTRGGLTETGSFVDSPVSGISYSTDSYAGLTDDNGTFRYIENEIVEFSIGNLVMGAAVADSTITPLELGTLTNGNLSYESNHQDRATNTLRLLQTLDSDGYPENGISISDSTVAAINELIAVDGVDKTGGVNGVIDFNLEETVFETQATLVQLLSAATNTGILVTPEQAIAHFKETLKNLEKNRI